MAETTYTYSIEDDFPNQKMDPGKLTDEIRDSSITIALDHITSTNTHCFIVFKDSLSILDTTSTLSVIVSNHDGEPLPEDDPNPRMDDGRLIVRADSRPFDFQTYYTMVGDDSTAGIGFGQEIMWDFSNSDDIITGDHIPSGMKCKEFFVTFLCPVYTKDGCLYFFDAPWGCYVELDICIPPGEWYPNPAGPFTGEQLGMTGDTNKYANTGLDWVVWTSYIKKYRICGTCQMGDELNAEGSSVNPIPPGWALRCRIYTPTSDSVSKGFAELELHRCHATLLPGMTLQDIIDAH